MFKETFHWEVRSHEDGILQDRIELEHVHEDGMTIEDFYYMCRSYARAYGFMDSQIDEWFGQ